ncbi:MAG: polyprenol phosphomannose-dependent alpha 1,6 mannosyltransferase MptB [Actinomycetota bacterium]|nr:polyprenol phosphomannose-dependent alpha 1,6 mannosyltransferase MptB [Actinomycetota bacterium]
MTATAVLDKATRRAAKVTARLRAAVDRGYGMIERMRTPLPEARPYVAGETRIRRPLASSELLGFVGSLLVLWGASRPTSPFTLNLFTLGQEHRVLPQGMTTWFFGVGPPGNDNIFVGVVAVYAGMLLMMRAWLRLHRLTRLHPGIPLSRFVPVFCCWVLPLLVVAPLFSHDVYSYVAQGEQMSRHVNPYKYGPQVLGVGGNPFASGVDPIWTNVTSPYGPVFLWLAGAIMTVVNHGYLAALVGFRLEALFGTVLLAVFTPRLARSYGLDGSKAFVLVALNPLVLLHLVAGAHNDALMMGFLVAGLAVARERHPIAGIVLCSIGALVKVPAVIGVAYIGWDWLGDDLPQRRRIRSLVTAGLVSLAVMAALSELVGLGWGWVSALSNPDTVRSWMDPATAVGQLAGKIISTVGLGDHTHVLLTVARGLGLLLAAVIAVKLLWNAKGAGSLRALGLTMLAVVLLGPVVQPWYLVWGIVLLAPIAEGRLRSVVVGLSVVASFLGLPGGRALLHEILVTNPFVIALFVAVLVAVAAVPLVPRVRKLYLERGSRVLASRP